MKNEENGYGLHNYELSQDENHGMIPQNVLADFEIVEIRVMYKHKDSEASFYVTQRVKK